MGFGRNTAAKAAGLCKNFADFSLMYDLGVRALRGDLTAKELGYALTHNGEYIARGDSMNVNTAQGPQASGGNKTRMQPDMPYPQTPQRDDFRPRKPRPPGF